MNPYLIVPLVAFMVNTCTMAYVSALDMKNQINRAFFIFLGIITIWIAAGFPFYLPFPGGWKVPYCKFCSVIWFSSGLSMLNFIYAYTQRPRDIFFRIAILIMATSVALCVGTDLVVSGYQSYSWGWRFSEGILFAPASHLSITLPFLFGAGLVFRDFSANPDPIRRRQLTLILSGITLSFFIAMVVQFIAPRIPGFSGSVRYTAPASAIMCIFVFYTVVRYRFLMPDVKDVSAEMFAHVGVGIVITDRTGTVLHLNDSASIILGNGKHDHSAKKTIDAYFDDDLGRGFISDRETTICGTKRIVIVSRSDIITGGLVTGAIWFMKDITDRKQVDEELRQSLEKLRERNDVFEKELSTAKMIHAALLPQSPPSCDWLNIAFRYRPLEAVGGDYFNIVNLNEGGLSVFIGDVSGHGVPAALFLSLIKSVSDRLLRKFACEPAEYLSRLNKDLSYCMQSYFLTALYGVFVPGENDGAVRLSMACGGHPSPIVYRKKAENAEYIAIRGKVLGIVENISYENNDVILQKGDRVYFYTDGLPESMDENPENLGFDRLADVIRDCSTDDLDSTLDAIMKSADSLGRVSSNTDDIVLIGIEIR